MHLHTAPFQNDDLHKIHHLNIGDVFFALQKKSGAIAQLGEHLLCKQGVRGSIPRSSTMLDKSMINYVNHIIVVFLPNVIRKENVNVLVTCSLTNWKPSNTNNYE